MSERSSSRSHLSQVDVTQPHGGVVVRLGSQVDVVMPARLSIRVDVRAGERVYAGRSVLARLDDKHP